MSYYVLFYTSPNNEAIGPKYGGDQQELARYARDMGGTNIQVSPDPAHSMTLKDYMMQYPTQEWTTPGAPTITPSSERSSLRKKGHMDEPLVPPPVENWVHKLANIWYAFIDWTVVKPNQCIAKKLNLSLHTVAVYEIVIGSAIIIIDMLDGTINQAWRVLGYSVGTWLFTMGSDHLVLLPKLSNVNPQEKLPLVKK